MPTNTYQAETGPTLHAGTVDEDMLTAAETASLLNVPLSWVYDHVRADSGDRLPFVKLGKYLRFCRRDLLAYIDAKRAELQARRHRH